jgi:hypothetical protein
MHGTNIAFEVRKAGYDPALVGYTTPRPARGLGPGSALQVLGRTCKAGARFASA